jgi:Uma2 family endonuclease
MREKIMSALPKKRYSIEEYLTIERDSQYKHEYHEGEILAMAGTSPDHDTIAVNTLTALNVQLKKRPCRVFSSEMRVRVTPQRYNYPDIKVVCGTPQYTNDNPPALLNPIVIIEIASASTAEYDRTEKFAKFRRIASLQEYMLVAQYEVRVEHWVRQDDINWHVQDIYDINAIIELKTIGCTLALADMYDKIEFDENSE